MSFSLIFSKESGFLYLARCTHGASTQENIAKYFRKNLKLCENDYEQMVWMLAKFGGQITSDEFYTKLLKMYVHCLSRICNFFTELPGCYLTTKLCKSL